MKYISLGENPRSKGVKGDISEADFYFLTVHDKVQGMCDGKMFINELEE